MTPWHRAGAATWLLLLAACASFKPLPLEEVPFRERAETETRGEITVSTAVLSREESKQVFGVDLAAQGIQPVWLQIENASDLYWGVLMTATDPNYFSAHEAAYKSHFGFRPVTNARMDEHFDALALEPEIDPGDTNAGFMFTNLKLGTKEVRLKLYGPRRTELFEFYVQVPGFTADYTDVDWDALDAQEFRNFTDDQELAQALRELPCCTTRQGGSGEGDPLNLIIIGTPEDVAAALVRSGWDETEKLTFASAWRTFKAFWGGEYKYSPMSSLYVYGRSQDAGFQKARDTIHERNHLRLWMSDMKFHGEQVWIGTITRDIGVYFTTKAWNLTTHAIDPYVDEARMYIAEDFANALALERWGYVTGVGSATREEPHRNLMNAPWWTDGLRIVLHVSHERVPLEEVGFFYWDWTESRQESEAVNRELRRALEP